MSKIDDIYRSVMKLQEEKPSGVSAKEVAELIGLDRSNVSRYLNIMHKERKLIKAEGRPVLYKAMTSAPPTASERKGKEAYFNSLDKLAGSKQSLGLPIEKAKAAIIYPPKGLHTLLLGETGVGKSLFAEQMYEYAKETGVLGSDAPFIRFNCADYADNPSLLTAHIFGVKKGTYTGADKDKDGLLKQADKGILFLDEVHRLPPQGQEMLFTYIDKGCYSPLGETDKLHYAEVRIIAATTENPSSYLLQTFSRRIPMVILLPNLSERSLSERYSLIDAFIKEESRRVGKSIYINKNVIISLLLYDCPNNIGQLKSDIQLSCAKAFLNYKAAGSSYLIINQCDLPNHVRMGMMNIKEHRKEIDELLSSAQDVLKFSEEDEPPLQLTHENEGIGEDFYSIIEQKIDSLKTIGMEDTDINEILNLDIKSHFQKYIGEISQRFIKDEITNVVDGNVLKAVEEILALAKANLDREYDEKIYFGLSFHLERSIERIRRGEKIYNPKLNFIRINYEEEFLFAMKMAKLIDRRFNIEIPVDEIGYITMFFTADPLKIAKEEMPKVKVVVAMHGRSTASSMAEVVNNLIGAEYVVSIDSPLTMKPESIYKIARDKILELDQGEGVILMVDMGSLTNFGFMIAEETGINVQTVDMVSTLMVLDVARKAMMGYAIDEIMDSLSGRSCAISTKEERPDKKNIILAVCFTGDGSAKRISDMINKKIGNRNVKAVPVSIIDKKSLRERVAEMEKGHNIWAIVGTVEIKMRGIPFISAVDILTPEGDKRLRDIIDEGELYYKMGDSLDEHLIHISGEKIIKDAKNFIMEAEERLETKLSKDVKVGMTMHICFLLDNMLSGAVTKPFDGLSHFKDRHSSDMDIIKRSLKDIERDYRVSIGDDEIAYIVKLFKENGNTVQ